MPVCVASCRWRGVGTVVGGILVHLTLGTLYTFGNLNPYMTSFMRSYGSAPDLTYTECSWVYALAAMGQGISMTLGGVLEKRVGPRWTTLMGAWILSLGTMLTFFTIKHSLALTIITYGAIYGFGIGIAYAVPLSCAMRWFPAKKGLVNGIVVAGFGGGAFIFNLVQTAFINPDNLKAEEEHNGEKYFNQPSVLDKVPYIFLLLGGCYAMMQFIGSLLICNPPTQEQEISIMEEEAERAEILSHSNENNQAMLLGKPPPVNSSMSVHEDDLRPSEVLRSKYFYMLWFMFLCNGQGSVFISSLYKAYGQTFIADDTFLALVGSFASVFNAVGRIHWGSIADRFSFRVSMLIMTATFTCLMLTLNVSEYGGKAVFFIYVCLLFGTFSGSFSLFPTATAKCFGRQHISMNYGLLFTSQSITAPLGVFLSQKLKSSIGWNGLFFLVSGFTFTSFVTTILFNAKDKNNHEI